MKSLIGFLIAGAAFAAAADIGRAAVAEVGRSAPDFTLTDIGGAKHSLSEFKGSSVVLEWVNPECPIVVKHYDKSRNIPKTQEAAIRKGVVWLTINSAHPGAQGDYSPADIAAWMKRTGASPTAYFRDQDVFCKPRQHRVAAESARSLTFGDSAPSLRPE